MAPLEGMQDPAIIAVTIAALAAGGLVVFVYMSARADARWSLDVNAELKHIRPRDEDAPRWLVGTAAALLLIAITSWLGHRDERILAAERRADREAELVRLGCAPRQAGDTDIITLTIDTAADPHTAHGQRVLGCARYVDRGWHRGLMRKQVAEVAR